MSVIIWGFSDISDYLIKCIGIVRTAYLRLEKLRIKIEFSISNIGRKKSSKISAVKHRQVLVPFGTAFRPYAEEDVSLIS